jgi:hypothetical protein
MTGFGFWTPLLLGGIGLIVLPWLIHRIRRPERDTVEFSSLLFIPNIKQEIIERRRIQHPLLMLLRMLLLLLLAVSFARPYLLADPVSETPADQIHLILLDVSLSTSGSLDETKAYINALLDDIPASHRIGLMTFADHDALLIPIEDASMDGAHTSVRSALDTVAPTWSSTDYVSAMASAERHLLTSARGDTLLGKTLHLVSDFQESGLKDGEGGWRLSGDITFVPHAIDPPKSNLALTDAVIVEQGEAHRLKVRVRNTGSIDATTEARVEIDGRIVGAKKVSVRAGNARQMTFDLKTQSDTATEGFVAIEDEGGISDNLRYFAWNPPVIPRIAITGSSLSTKLIAAALPSDRWRIVADLDPSVALVVTDQIDRLDRQTAAYVSGGGSLFLTPSHASSAATWNQLFAESTGIRLSETINVATTLSEIDLAHPIFSPLRGPRFNDFSAVRYKSHLTAEIEPGASTRILAAFDTGRPAILEATVGEGRIIVWLGGIAPGNTNLTRSPRFIPLLQETVAHLIDIEDANTDLLVGELALLRVATGGLTTAEGDALQIQAGDALPHPGWLTESGDLSTVSTVNFDPAETDLTRIPVSEFQLRLCHAEPAAAQLSDAQIIPGEDRPRIEHGYLIVLIGTLALLIENLYTARLGTTA